MMALQAAFIGAVSMHDTLNLSSGPKLTRCAHGSLFLLK